ncbi:MAG: carboxypeptidase-like regulatory domain-containing protein [Gemmatimonadota bacterium]|nr:carboxypeptidase-like regulatory domain-containing protein [Gemmatimonadota bacterium]
MPISFGSNEPKVAALAICLLAAGCGPRPNFVPFDTYSAGQTAIYGYVTDLYSCGLAGAVVRIEGEAEPAVTNNSGRYRLRVRTGESYALTVGNNGFAGDSITLEVGVEPLRYDFLLVPEPDCPDGNCRPYRPPCRAGQYL